MRYLILIAMMVVSTVGEVQGANETRERVVGGLLRLGKGLLENELEKREDAAKEAGKKAAETTEPQQRTWGQRGADMAGTFAATVVDEFGKRSTSEVLAFSVKDALDVLINEYKEQYKKEGREYARELGDRMVERVKADPKISKTLTAIEVLCWSIIGYLSFVTLFVFFALIVVLRGQRRLSRGYEGLCRKIDELQQEVAAARGEK